MNKAMRVIHLMVVVTASVSFLSGGSEGTADKYERHCYVDTWAQNRKEPGSFDIDDLNDVTLCTHLVFVHAEVDPEKLTLLPFLQNDASNYRKMTALKTSHPDLKVLLLVGGTSNFYSSVGDISSAFSQVVNTTSNMDTFVRNALKDLRLYRFDGIELDWRYPGYFGSIPEDVGGFTDLLKIFRQWIDAEAENTKQSKLQLHVRVTGDRLLLTETMQVPQLSRIVDKIVVHAYDFYIAEDVIGHNTALFPRNNDTNYFATLNVNYIVQYLLKFLEVPSSKLMLGLPAFGRSVLFVNSTLKRFGVPHNGTALPGPYSGQRGILAYYEICGLVDSGWTAMVDVETLTPFAFSNQEIVTYDNTISIAHKANYIKDHKLAGAALWDLSLDDFTGRFCDQGRFPLASALKRTLTSPRSSCPAGHRGKLDELGCEPCPEGSFQPLKGALTCLPCPRNTTTLQKGSVHQYKCILPCLSGTEYNFVTSNCDPCPLGYARVAGRDPACLKCGQNYTTVATGSTKCVRRPDTVPESDPRQIDVTSKLVFAAASCENKPVLVGAIRSVVTDNFQRLATAWEGLCLDSACSNVVTDLDQGCEASSSRKRRRRRRKRQAAEEKLLVSILVANVTEELHSSDAVRQTTSVISAALNEREDFKLLTIYGIRFLQLDSLEAKLVCEQGSGPRNGQCEPCEAGWYHNSTLGSCSPCPVGLYQPLQAQTNCLPCPGVLSTRTTGAQSPDACVSPCEARPNYCYNGGACRWTEENQGSVYCECEGQYQGQRCANPLPVSASKGSDETGTIVGAVVGGVLGLLILLLIVVGCCVCYRVRKAVKVRTDSGMQDQPGWRVSPYSNPYTPWDSFSKAAPARGVKFIDYVDYYAWMSSLSDQQPAIHEYSQRRSPASSAHSLPKYKSSKSAKSKIAENGKASSPTTTYQNIAFSNATPEITETSIDSEKLN